MERKVGEVFTYKGKTYKVVTNNKSCNNCAFKNNYCKRDKSITGECISFIRNDGKNIIFKEINNMKIKNNQLTIDIPKGMEIDTENSDLAKGIIKFKPKNFTYDNIEETLGLFKTRTGIPADISNVNKLCAIDKLMNIAKYYNKDWKPNWDNSKEHKYSIRFDNYDSEFLVDNNFTINSGSVYFKNKEDAQSIIDNPNFREILDVIYRY